MFKLMKALLWTPGPKYSWKKVMLVLTLSTVAISGSAAVGYLFYRYAQHQQILYSAGMIRAIVQTTPQSGTKSIALETSYLAETLNLSADSPTNLSQFDLGEAKKCLLKTSIIKDVRLKKMKPDLLFVHYTTRIPFAFLEDYTNTAIDEEGVLFPYSPFYPPRCLPHIYLGRRTLSLNPWGERIAQDHLVTVQTLLATLGDENIERIDLSQIEDNSSGRRELVVILKGGCFIRLNPKNYVQQLAHYSILKNTCLKEADSAMIDLRLPEVAYILRKN